MEAGKAVDEITTNPENRAKVVYSSLNLPQASRLS